MKVPRTVTALLIFFALVTLAAGGVLKVYLLATRQINEDEFMHLQWSWAMTQGDLPNRDFVMPHTPLAQMLLMPFFRFFYDDPSILFYARGLFSAFAVGTLVFMFLVARKLFGTESAWMSLIAAVPVAAYASKSIEVRPDQINALLGMIMIWLLARDRPRFFAAGLCAGLALVCNQKFAPMGVFVGIGALVAPADSVSRRIRRFVSFGGGALVLAALFFLWAAAVGILQGYLHSNYIIFMHSGNVGAAAGQALNIMRWTFHKNLLVQNVPFAMFTLAGLVWSARSLAGRDTRSLSIWLWLYLAGMVFLNLLTVSHELQQTLYLVPVMAVFCGHGAWSLLVRLGRKRSIALQSVLLGAMVLTISLGSFVFTGSFLRDKNKEQFSTWNHILSLVPPGAYVMDGHAGMFVYRRNALWNHTVAFAEGADMFYAFYESKADAAAKIIDALQRRNVRLVILEDVFAEVLPPEAIAYIETHYRRVDGYVQPLYVNDSTF